jgi:hypothetical protein
MELCVYNRSNNMPTSPDEAIKIHSIINEYIDHSVAQELTRRLDEEVGQMSDNASLRESLEMLRKLYE